MGSEKNRRRKMASSINQVTRWTTKQAANVMNRYGYYENTFDFVLNSLKVKKEDIAWFKTILKAKEY